MRLLAGVVPALTLVLGLAAAPRAHADPQDIEDGEPVTLEDADIEPPGWLAVQYSGTYDRVNLGQGATDLVEQGPTFKFGLFKGVQVSLNPNYDSGSAPGHNAGFELTDLKIRLTSQSGYVPAVAIDLFQSQPFGAGPKSSGYVFRGIASESLGPADTAPRLHLNVTDYRVNQPDSRTRHDQVQVIFGGSTLVTSTDAVVGDVVYGDSDEIGRTQTFLEIGWSRDLPQDWTAQIGVGRQVAGNGDATRVYFAIEKDIDLF